MKKYKIIISASFHPNINKWTGLSVIMGKKGTHDNYDITYNGECMNDYFDCEADAKNRAEFFAK